MEEQESPCTDCDYYSGTLSGNNDSATVPNGTHYYTETYGTHEGWLEGPNDSDFDLYLYKWNQGGWEEIAKSESLSSSEYITYTGSSGYYYWSVRSYNGAGPYDIWLNLP